MRASATNNLSALREELLKAPSSALERLAAELVEVASGLPVRQAASGAQSGADAGAATIQRTIRVEAKRYGDDTRLSERELLGEVAQAFQRDPLLEAWILVATREVPEQTISALRKYSEDHGAPVLVLDWAGSPPTLALLCAACPDAVRATHGAEAAAAAEALATQVDAGRTLKNLRRDLEQWSAGWALTATRCRAAIHEVVTSRSESKAHFRQDLAIAVADSGFVRRDVISRPFDAWCATSEPGQPLLVIGEEGRGKSWALASWLFSQPEDETVIVYCSSSEFRTLSEHTVEKVLAHALSKRAGPLGFDYWSKRIERLKEALEPVRPLIWLVIDGLNETASVDWCQLFLHAQRDVWRPRLRIIASCRTRYFMENLQSGRSWTRSPVVVDVPLFTPAQRDDALKARGVDSGGLSESVLALALVPRICRLVAATAERLRGVELITFERLLFEYGKRFDPDTRVGLSDDVWLAFLRELARAAREGVAAARRSQVRTWIDVREDKAVEAALSDIVDGRLVRHAHAEPGFLEFDRDLVLVANGLVLWKLIEKAQLRDQTGISDLLARELEPLGGIDERPRIVAAALAAATIFDRTPETIRPAVAALVAEGVTAQNLGSDQECSLLSYAKTFPSGFLDALSALARANRDDEADLLSWAVRSVADTPHVQTAIVETAIDWIRIVPLRLGDEAQRPESQRPRTNELTRWLGRIPDVGELEVLGMRIVIEAGDGHHRLPLHALRLIQVCPLATPTFWRGFAVSGVLDYTRVMSQYASWIVRLNNRDYDATCEVLKSEAAQLLKQAPPVGTDKTLPNRAAAKLLWLVGEDAFDRRARELVPEPDGWSVIKSELDAPNTSVFSLHRCQVDKVLEESDQSVGQLIGRVSAWWPDPDLTIPPKFIKRAIEYAEKFDFSEVRPGMGATANDHAFSVSRPALARCSGSALSALSRRALRELGNRTGDKWAFLAWDLADLWLIASADDRAAAQRELARGDIGECGDRRKEHARLVLRMLASAHDKPEQYPFGLIADGADMLTGPAIGAFETLSADAADRLLVHVSRQNTSSADWIFVNVLAHSDTPVSETAARYLLRLSQSPLEGIRLHALFVLAATKCRSVAAEFAETGWSWRQVGSDAERCHGSNILLAIDPLLPIADVLTRVAPWRLPAAARLRRSLDDSRIIARTITGLLSTKDAPLRHPFDERVVIEPTSLSAPLESLKLEERDATDLSVDDLRRALDVDTRLRDLSEAERETIRLIASERGGIRAFYGEWIEPDHLGVLVDAAPEELNYWLSDLDTGGATLVSKIRNAAGFYVSLCQLLLQRDPERGVRLWRIVDRVPHATQFIGKAGVDARLLAAFTATESEKTLQLWNELWDLPRTANDLALFKIVLAAESAGRGAWLDARIAEDTASGRPWRRDRARSGSAFRISAELNRAVLNRSPGLRTHGERVEDRAASIAARAVWQRHWLTRYFTATSSDDAFGALTLFIEVADSRWSLVVRDLRREGIAMPEDRVRYLRIRRSDIDRATKKFEDGLRDVFLGERVQRDLWPWLCG